MRQPVLSFGRFAAPLSWLGSDWQDGGVVSIEYQAEQFAPRGEKV
jgi:hypothetical protein